MKAPTGCLEIQAAAKILNSQGIAISAGRLFRELRNREILQDDNLPRQKYMGWFRVARGSFIRTAGGKREMYCRTFVTEAGLERIKRILTPVPVIEQSIDDDETSSEIAARTGMAWDDSLDRMPACQLGI